MKKISVLMIIIFAACINVVDLHASTKNLMTDTWNTISAGGGQSILIRPDGSLWLWGNNANGQLGNKTVGGDKNIR